MSEFQKAGAVSDFPENRTTQVKLGDMEVCVANHGGQLTAFYDSCTHAQAMLSGCPVEDGQVTCPLHAAKFDVTTGQALCLPATKPLKLFEVKVEGDAVLINVAE